MVGRLLWHLVFSHDHAEGQEKFSCPSFSLGEGTLLRQLSVTVGQPLGGSVMAGTAGAHRRTPAPDSGHESVAGATDANQGIVPLAVAEQATLTYKVPEGV